MGTEPERSTSFGATRESPLAVGRAAAEHGLGALVDVRQEITPIRAAGRGAAGVAGCLVLLFVAGAVSARLPNPSLVRTLSLWLLAALLGLLLYCVGWTVHALGDAFVDRILDSVGAPAGSAGAQAPHQRVTDEQREIWRMHGARSMVTGGLWVLFGAALLAQSVSRQSGGAAPTVFACAVVFGAYRIVMGYFVHRKADETADERTAEKARV